MQDFTKWDVIRDARELAAGVYRLLPYFPVDERFALCQQLRRASTSVGANIAEGAGRHTRKDMARFLSQAIGSASEVEFLLQVSEDLQYIPANVRKPLDKSVRDLKFRIEKLRLAILDGKDR